MEGLAPDAARDAVVEKAHDRGIVRRERLDCAEAHAQDFGRDRSDERRLGVGRREARPDQIARKEKRRDLPRRIGQGDIQNERPEADEERHFAVLPRQRERVSASWPQDGGMTAERSGQGG
jgi:hypothetical protein